METQYANIAEAYANRGWHPTRKMCYEHWVQLCREMVKGEDLKEKKVCDLGCGAGDSSRLLADQGAFVIGVEPESKFLEIACREEEINPLGIDYFLGKLPFEMPAFEDASFDLVTGAFLLHYAASKEELLAMTQEIHRILKPGGAYVGINHDPENPVTLKRLETVPHVIDWSGKPFIEGSKIRATINCEGSPSFKAYFWKTKTYSDSFFDAGFDFFCWRYFVFPKNTRPENWKEAEKNLCIKLMMGTKPL